MAKRTWISQMSASYIPQGYPTSRAACTKALKELLATCAKVARSPYSDEVQVVGPESPLDVGEKIAKAIERIGQAENRLGGK